MSDLIDRYYPVLDHGFVALVDSMGDDSSIERAARVSYGKGTRSVSETRGLLRYLMRHRHTTPFEMVELKFHMALPIFVARQLVRHRTANINEYSGRYSEMPNAFYLPEESRLQKQSKSNRQGSEIATVDRPKAFRADLDGVQALAYEDYERYLGNGLTRELARINLPVSNYTQWYWKIDLHNLFHFLSLRMDSHAQYEIRVYANVMAGLAQTVAPLAVEAWSDYVFNGMHFSRAEQRALADYIAGGAYSEGASHEGMSSREVSEFIEKVNRITSGSHSTVPELPDNYLTPGEAQERLFGPQEAA